MTPLGKAFRPVDYIGLTVEKPTIPDLVHETAEEKGLTEKSEFHISVLVAKNAQIAWKAVHARADAAEVQKSIEALFMSFAWHYTPTSDYFLHERSYTKGQLEAEGDLDTPPHLRRSIVQKVVLPDLISFYQKINGVLDISLPLPVPHITLFAWSDYEPYKTRGIGICSRKEFERFTKKMITAA